MSTLPDTPVASRPRPLPVAVVGFDAIERGEWERLLRVTPAATPFSAWTVHRAWWDAYAEGVEPRYLLIGEDPVRGIVPLMTRSTSDAPGQAIHLAATYHADYATALASDSDIDAVAAACVEYLSREATDPALSRVDLRRFRADDPFLEQLRIAADQQTAETGWSVRREQEDVCPVVPLAASWPEQLAGLGKKARHEIRRKLRRAQALGPLRLRYAALDEVAAARFIDMHQARWGEAGLFADTPDGRRSRRFLQRLVELEAAEGPAARFHIGEVTAGDRVIHMQAGFAAGGTCYYYNAGMDPQSLDLSPGIVGTALYLRDRIEKGDGRFDFLRGNEPYKYEWGAIDEPIYRLLIRPRDTT